MPLEICGTQTLNAGVVTWCEKPAVTHVRSLDGVVSGRCRECADICIDAGAVEVV